MGHPENSVMMKLMDQGGSPSTEMPWLLHSVSTTGSQINVIWGETKVPVQDVIHSRWLARQQAKSIPKNNFKFCSKIQKQKSGGQRWVTLKIQ